MCIQSIYKIYTKYIQKTMSLNSSRKLRRVSVLFNDALHNQDYVASMIDKQTNVKLRCYDADKERLQYSENVVSQCCYVHQKSHTE